MKNVNLKDIRNELLLKMKDLSWAALNLEGSVLTVDVSETKYEEKEENSPSNLKAAYDGVIKKTEVISGTLKVRAGDAVSKGDLLVSGFVEYNDGANLPVVSKGKIFAEVDTEIVVEQPLKITENVKTGKIKKRSVLNFFGLKIPLYLGTVKGSFEIERENKTFGENYSPVSITTAVFYMTEEKERTLENAELTKMLNISAEKRLESNLGDCEVLSKKEKIYYEENKAILKQKLTVLKDISYTEKLLLDIENQK